MDELLSILNLKFQEILSIIQTWWILISVLAGSVGTYWVTIKQIWPYIKRFLDAQKKLRQLQNEQNNLDLREELLLVKEDNFNLKEKVERLSRQLEIKEHIT